MRVQIQKQKHSYYYQNDHDNIAVQCSSDTLERYDTNHNNVQCASETVVCVEFHPVQEGSIISCGKGIHRLFITIIVK